MGVTINVWLAKDGNVGHGSMSLSDGTYISWWPKEDKDKQSVRFHWSSVDAQTSPSYDNDREAEGRVADFRYEIKSGKIDENAIKTWWAQFSDTSKYHLLGNNCCTVVFTALEKGGAKKYASFPIFTTHYNPGNLNEYAKQLKTATD